MNSIDLTPLYRSSVGFDRLASLIDHEFATDTNANGYPPYNIEMLDEQRYAITLAVAGFSQQEIKIEVEKGVLSIRGNKPESNDSKFLHRGIPSRTFERNFNLADYVEVTGAELVNGLLTISLVREIPEAMKPKTISINGNEKVLEHQANSKAEAKGGKAS